jgi:hypothetical protein
MRIGRDPETGALGAPRPDRALTIEQMQELARQEAAGLVTIRNADGSETLNHEGRFIDFSIVRLGQDGKPVHDCIQGEAVVRRVLRTQPSRPLSAPEGDSP